MSMYCYQCEQTAAGTGCDKIGVCGKGPDTAGLQDLLVHCAKMLARYAHLGDETLRSAAAKLAAIVNGEADFEPDKDDSGYKDEVREARVTYECA